MERVTTQRLVVVTARMIVVLQMPVLGVLCIGVAATLNLWFYVYLPLFLLPALVLLATVQRATVRVRQPWRGWSWIDLVLNSGVLVVGASVWLWALRISLDGLDSTQRFWLVVTAVLLLAMAGMVALVGYTILSLRRDPMRGFPPPPRGKM